MSTEADIVESKPMLIEMGIGWKPVPGQPGQVTSVTPADYVAEILRLRAERDAAARVSILDDELLVEWIDRSRKMHVAISIDDDCSFGCAIRQDGLFIPAKSEKWSEAVDQIREAIRSDGPVGTVIATDRTGGAI